MRRPTRFTASLIRTFVVGGIATGGALSGNAIVASGAVVTASTMLLACQDDSQPEYWIEKLEDKKWQPEAIKRLSQFFEDSLTRADKDMSKPEVKGLLDKLAQPLNDIYVNEYSNLDEKTREKLINLLASFRDPRAEGALKKAFEEFGKRGRGGRDVKWASRAVRDMKLKSAAPAVFEAFKKTDPTTKEGAYYRDLNEALLAIADPAWANELKLILEEDFPIIKQDSTADAKKEQTHKTYRVITAAQILGELGDASAVPGLMKVVLDPTKAGAANEALLALTKIGKPSVDAAVKLLNDQDPALAEFYKKQTQKATGAKSPPEGKIHVPRAALILGTIGRKEGIDPMLAALKATSEDGTKAELLKALAMLPHTPEVKSAFADGLKSIPKDASINGANAIQSLADSAVRFLDPSMASILVDRAGDIKDDPVAHILISLAAMKIMDQGQVASVGKLVSGLPKDKEQLKTHVEKVNSSFELAKKVLAACKKDAACYLTEAKKSENQSDKTQMAAIKALYSFGGLKGKGAGKELVAELGHFELAELRLVVADIIDHLNPDGSKEIADALDKIVEANKDSMDKGKASADKPLRDVLYRLRARAQ